MPHALTLVMFIIECEDLDFALPPITSARSTRLGADLSYEDSGSCVSWEEEGGNV